MSIIPVMAENPYDGKILRKRLDRLRPLANERLLAREADNMSPNTLRAVLDNESSVREGSILRVFNALARLETRFAPRVKTRVAG